MSLYNLLSENIEYLRDWANKHGAGGGQWQT